VLDRRSAANRTMFAGMRILFIGGTGLISSACSVAALEAGHELWLLNRGRSPQPPAAGARLIHADIRDEAATRDAVAGKDWDAVVQWVAFTPGQVAQDLRVFTGRTGQYVFISSASIYQKPPANWLITEATPTVNPFWRYSQEKIACEALLAGQDAVPWTVVRPSHTYGPSQIPVAVNSWAKPFTVIERMRRGAPVIVPGDGTSLWTLTHNSDFARAFTGLLGRKEALREAFHITSEEALTWGQIYQEVARAAHAEANFVHVPTDAFAGADPDTWASLWGDKSHCAVFDNSKIRSLVPGWRALVPFAEGISQAVEWFDADPSRQEVDEQANQLWDSLAAIYQDALTSTRSLGISASA
jgi:nucleoside-diphosphate-sugar epimerase